LVSAYGGGERDCRRLYRRGRQDGHPGQGVGQGVSFRRVGDQDPDDIRRNFRAFVEERLPADCTASFHNHGGDRAINQPSDSPWIRKAQRALSDEWRRPAVLIAMGGSIPIVTQFKRILGMDSLLIGFGLEDDRIHSPNEKYNLTSYHRGTRSWARVLAAIAE
jgi:acetylornithine deacetylase/succinyl-diaminopimelate desuccinylase-like protein